MKLLVLSDLHLEYDHFVVQEEAIALADVIVLAGDIHPAADGIVWARQSFGAKPIVYVAGNHEFYGCDFDGALAVLRQSARQHDVHFLENDCVTIEGIRFLGCTLWTDFEFDGQERKAFLMERAQVHWPDYTGEIRSNKSRTGRLQVQQTIERHWQSRAWLQAQLPLGESSRTVVVTHHYPSKKSTSPKFVGDEMNVAFGSHIPVDLIRHVGLWIHGHAHHHVNYRIGHSKRSTRVIANPRGFESWANEPENYQFNPGYLVEHLPDGNWAQYHEL